MHNGSDLKIRCRCLPLVAVHSFTTSPAYDRRDLAPPLGTHVAAQCVPGQPVCVSVCLRFSAHTWSPTCEMPRVLLMKLMHREISWSMQTQVAGYGVVQTVNVCTIFVISGLTLRTDDAVQALRRPRGLAGGLVAILALTPMFGCAVRSIPFRKKAFATGLTVFCAVPTTLSSGVALVQAVRLEIEAAQGRCRCNPLLHEQHMRCNCDWLVFGKGSLELNSALPVHG